MYSTHYEEGQVDDAYIVSSSLTPTSPTPSAI